MKKNIGNTDKLIRLSIALVIVVLYLLDVIPNGTWTIVLAVVAVAMVATSLMNFCGLYAIFGWSTSKTKEVGKP